ncbi:hypothetical protein VPH35_111785 [Triticum aestivum]
MVRLRGSIFDPAAPARSHAWLPGFAPLSVLFSLPAAFIIYRNIVRQTRVPPPPLPLPAAPLHTGTHTLPPPLLLLRCPASSVSSRSRPASASLHLHCRSMPERSGR